MANYNGWSRTNYFKVDDIDAFTNLISHLDSEDTIEVFDDNKEDGVIGFGCNSDINGYVIDMYDEDPDVEIMINEFQDILPDGEAMVLLHIGHTKLNYVNASALVVTKNGYERLDLADLAEEKARELLGNEDYKLEF